MATMAMSGGEMERMHSRRPAQRRAATVPERNADLYEQQRARRRGPTPEMFFTKHIDNSRIVKADDPERRKEMRSFTIVMTVFFMLTIGYVAQHFGAINLGYDIESQKLRVEQLREDNRQLRLSEARLSDPAVIDAKAKELGLGEPMPGQVVRFDGTMQTPVVAEVREQGLGIGN